MLKKEKIKDLKMKHKLVHETINIKNQYNFKGWNIVGSVNWKIGKKTELDDPNKTFHYIEGFDKAGTLCHCIGEVVNGQIYNVLFEYLMAKENVIYPLENVSI